MNNITEKVNMLRNHFGFRRYLKNTGWVLFSRIFTLGISFLASIYTAKILGPSDYGIVNFVISFVSIAGSSIFVIDSILIKKLNSEPENTNSILGSALLIKILNACFAICTATIIALFLNTDSQIPLLVLVFSVFGIFQSFNIIDFYFQAHAQSKKISILNASLGIISSGVKILIVAFHLPVWILLSSYVFDHLCAAIGYVYLYTKHVGKISLWKINNEKVIFFLKQSWPFSISVIASSIYIRIDQIFIKSFIDSSSVGIYAVAVRFSEIWFFISSALCASLLPAILNAHKTDKTIFLRRSKHLYSLLFYIAITICFVMFFIAPAIITALYGTAYSESGSILRIYIWSIVGVFLSAALQQFLLAEDKSKTILILNVTGMILSVILNVLLIPRYGLTGAATANIFAYTLPFIFVIMLPSMKDQRTAVLKGIFKPLA